MRIFSLVKALILAVPAYFIWNYLAPIYWPQAPAQYLDVPYWHIAGVFALIQIVKMVIFPSHRFWRHRHFAHYGRFGCGRPFGRRGYWTQRYRHQ